jgi:hypothetical protein
VAPEPGAHGEQHSLGSRRRDVDQRTDHERAVAGVDRLPLGHRRSIRVWTFGVEGARVPLGEKVKIAMDLELIQA